VFIFLRVIILFICNPPITRMMAVLSTRFAIMNSASAIRPFGLSSYKPAHSGDDGSFLVYNAVAVKLPVPLKNDRGRGRLFGCQ
jgi:hypothetical protein